MTDLDPLRNLHVASPCQEPWDGMRGDDRSRFCDRCELNVYNLSAMPSDEARDLIQNREGRVCVRFFQRPDGTVLTEDCPVGRETWRRRLARAASRVAALLSVVFGTLTGCAQPPADPSSPTPSNENHGSSTPTDAECIQGDIAIEIVGDPAIPEIMGRIRAEPPGDDDR